MFSKTILALTLLSVVCMTMGLKLGGREHFDKMDDHHGFNYEGLGGPCNSTSQCNGGTCQQFGTFNESGTSVNVYRCVCPNGYVGHNCSICLTCNMNVGGNTFKPCFNGGTCSSAGTCGVTCTCPTGYTGDKCQYLSTACSATQSSACPANSVCYVEPSPAARKLSKSTATRSVCVCKTGYYGRNCQYTSANKI